MFEQITLPSIFVVCTFMFGFWVGYNTGQENTKIDKEEISQLKEEISLLKNKNNVQKKTILLLKSKSSN